MITSLSVSGLDFYSSYLKVNRNKYAIQKPFLLTYWINGKPCFEKKRCLETGETEIG
jgi:hypothetical protein